MCNKYLLEDKWDKGKMKGKEVLAYVGAQPNPWSVYWFENFQSRRPSIIKSSASSLALIRSNNKMWKLEILWFSFALQNPANLLCCPFILKVKWVA